MNTIGSFRIGEVIAVSLDATTGDPSQASSVTAAMRLAAGISGDVIAWAATPAVPMVITYRAAAGSIPAGWDVSLIAATSATLAPGVWGIDAEWVMGGLKEITRQSALIKLSIAAVV
jgi:hypothetical protein